MQSIMKLLVLMALVSSVLPDPSKDVASCLVTSRKFTKFEGKYVDKRVHPIEEPPTHGPQTMEFQKKVYAKEKQQRLFECIGNRTDESSIVLLELNPKYQALSLSCRKQQHQPICDTKYKYRTMDGTCNNKMHPKWGSQFSCLQRFLPQNYEGVSGFRQSVCGGSLPEPRTLSLKIFTDQNRSNKNITNMATYFGQFMAHDMAHMSATFVSTKPIDCCSHPGKNQHPQCAPIPISRNDPFYSKFNVTCFNFVRAAPCETCDIGKLKCQHRNGEELLPPDNSLDDFSCGRNQETCFLTGDKRANMHTPLMILQTLFQREHNRIAEKLSKQNSFWDDEKLYQESRKINIAQMQVIAYKEYLPLLIGPDLIALYGLDITGKSIYDPSVDATIWAEFNGAAYRLHSLINAIVAEHGCKADTRHFRNNFHNAELIYEGNMSSLIKGICQSPAQQYDRHMTPEITNFLYKQLQGSWGLDITSLNIQRGRDIGLPSYTKMVKFWTLGLVDIQTFEQLNVYMDESNINILKEIYCDVRDIDLWVGLNNEKTGDNMLVGPTAGNIIARQFSDLKKGDRFFFQHKGIFNDKQLKALKQASLSRIICDNTKIYSMQYNALTSENPSNPILDCKNIPKVDLRYWADV